MKAATRVSFERGGTTSRPPSGGSSSRDSRSGCGPARQEPRGSCAGGGCNRHLGRTSLRREQTDRSSVPGTTPAGPSALALWRTQHRELVGDLQPAAAEAEERARPAAGRARSAPPAGRLEHAPPEQHALEVRRRDVVPERRGVEVAELGDRELVRREREADVRVRRASRAAARGRRARSRRGRTRARAARRRGCQAVSSGNARVDVARDEPEVGGRELPLLRRAVRARCASPAARGARARARRPWRRGGAGSTAPASRPARGSRRGAPSARERLLRALPEQHLQRRRRAPAGRPRGHVGGRGVAGKLVAKVFAP